MSNALLIACSVGKSIPTRVFPSSVPQGFDPAQWAEKLSSEPTARACDLYTGQSFKNLARLAEANSLDLWIFSAGLGFVPGNKQIPAYEASFSNEVPIKIFDRANLTRDDWVRKVSAATKNEFCGDAYEKVFCVLPDAYEDSAKNCISDDLIFITSRAGFKNSLKFDRRLNDPACPYKGRDVDYKYRMARCVFENSLFSQDSIEAYLSGFETRQRASRPGLTDAEVAAWLKQGAYKSFSAAHASFLDNGFAMGKRRLERFWGA